MRPDRRAPPPIGRGSRVSESPILREWKSLKFCGPEPDLKVRPASSAKVKMPSFSRKKSRFSGKKRENRVRLICSSSTSTWEKSVRAVRSRTSRGVTAHFASSPTSYSRTAPSGCCRPSSLEPEKNGLTCTLRPGSNAGRPSSVPASDIRKTRNCRGIAAQVAYSFRRRTCRLKLSPQACSPSPRGNRSVVRGIRISMIQPSANTLVSTS